MKGIKITLKPMVGWHIRNPATYRIERTYPVIPPTVLFGIVQNLFFTSSHKTPYRDIIALGGFPQTDIGLSLEMQRIVKIKSTKNIVTDRHEIEVAHSGPIDCYLLLKERAGNGYVECLENTIGDIVLLTTTQFPAKIEDVSVYNAIKTKSNVLLFSTSIDGLGFPYVLPL